MFGLNIKVVVRIAKLCVVDPQNRSDNGLRGKKIKNKDFHFVTKETKSANLINK